MSFINHMLNPFHKREDILKKARDAQIKKSRAEGRSDDEIIGILLCMPETHDFIAYALKHNPVKGSESLMRGQLTLSLKDAFTKSVKKNG
ncbi:MAG: hypothetical protein IMZ64_12900 [Bacteroidetes bacterium]|nr:hypothetical protein [Bacteroidota bacterium]